MVTVAVQTKREQDGAPEPPPRDAAPRRAAAGAR
jgi:hypothetical protein